MWSSTAEHSSLAGSITTTSGRRELTSRTAPSKEEAPKTVTPLALRLLTRWFKCTSFRITTRVTGGSLIGAPFSRMTERYAQATDFAIVNLSRCKNSFTHVRNSMRGEYLCLDRLIVNDLLDHVLPGTDKATAR